MNWSQVKQMLLLIEKDLQSEQNSLYTTQYSTISLPWCNSRVTFGKFSSNTSKTTQHMDINSFFPFKSFHYIQNSGSCYDVSFARYIN